MKTITEFEHAGYKIHAFQEDAREHDPLLPVSVLVTSPLNEKLDILWREPPAKQIQNSDVLEFLRYKGLKLADVTDDSTTGTGKVKEQVRADDGKAYEDALPWPLELRDKKRTMSEVLKDIQAAGLNVDLDRV